MQQEHPTSTVLDQLRYWYEQADYERSVALGESAVAAWRTSLGPDHELTLAQRHLATSMRELGEYEKAAELNQDSLARHRRRFGRDDPATLTAQNNLAVSLRWLGEAQQALSLDQDCYDLRATGEAGRATELFELMQATLQRDYGPDHPATRAATQGRRAEADLVPWET